MDIWLPVILALMSNNLNQDYNNINYLNKYTKYYKYGVDE